MADRAAPPRTLRGVFPYDPPVHWRADAPTADRGLPLVVALHGWGMDEDFFALLLQRLLGRPLRLLVPRAPFLVKDLGQGRVASSWYDYDGDPERFRRELMRTESLLLSMVAHVERQLDLAPRGRYLVGFSQGGYCGSWVAVRHPEVFDGMIVSGARVKTEFLEEEMVNAAAMGFRALLCHGTQDGSVPPQAAERSRDELVAAGVDVELRWFEAGHSLGRKQGEAIGDWIADDRTRREGSAQ